jgi:nitroimidazol reductase NimA-like FMN-containing flavoprotein (pyridoxamine 5'-phosphate oxidase superfamily)
MEKAKLRRSDKEITDKAEIVSILEKAEICRIAMCDNNKPYIIPMSFGYKDNTLYFHSAKKGLKLDIMRKNSSICFEAEVDVEHNESDDVCDWGTNYRSVIGYGRVQFIEGREEKLEALGILVKHYTSNDFEISETEADKVTVFKIPIDSITGKKSG